MVISDIDQEVFDYDWFAVDTDGHVLHFASAGGVLPASVAASNEALTMLQEYFNRLPETPEANKVQVVANVSKEKGVQYDSFVNYARRGLFSFDKTRLGARLDACYHLIARPQHELMLADLPTEVAAIISQTRWPFSVAGITTIRTSIII
ncbi:hypothetical protein JAO73_13705 [Hymenobacter sp. BT523]|uniref:hypothetical protein n=1 Tax=Hymenobacter sp. BT523 TaxID=2795725 RepID=UPI0018EB2D25|nr:hypothetical protein [Hymenobacter sp. BT523]MBJ6110073.1 hypothetical protein [Hymenobacter sp. BT523]